MSNPSEPATCRACFTPFQEGETVCSFCGFPQFEDAVEQKRWVKSRKRKKSKLKALEKRVEQGILPTWIAGFLSLVAVPFGFMGYGNLLFGLIMPVIYFCVAYFLFRQNEKAALVISLILFFGVITLNLMLGNLAGIILWVVGVVVIVRGLDAERKASELRQELDIRGGMRLEK